MQKQKSLNVGPKMLNLRTFVLEFKKAFAIFETPRIFLIPKFSFLKKYLGPKMAYMHLFGLKFESNFVIFEITTPEFFWLQNFVKK